MNTKVIRKLGFKQWFWLFEASIRLLLVRLRMRFSAPTWLNQKIKLSEVQRDMISAVEEDIPAHVNAMHESVRLAARIQPGKIECLPRSLVLADMLQARNMSGRVVIGVAKQGNRFASHAWVELDHRIVAEPEHVAKDFNKLGG